jgi:hypothetical protein
MKESNLEFDVTAFAKNWDKIKEYEPIQRSKMQQSKMPTGHAAGFSHQRPYWPKHPPRFR